MAATQIAKPFHRPGGVYEEKCDGWRMMAYKNGTAVHLVSRAARNTVSASPRLRRRFGVSQS